MKWMKLQKRLEIRYLLAQGLPKAVIAKRVGCHLNSVANINRKFPFAPWQRSKRHLSIEEREEVALGLQHGESMRSIAKRLGRSSSTISREVAKQDGLSYRAWRGEELIEKSCRRTRGQKLANNPKLVMAVERLLAAKWSPEQIAGRLKRDYPDDPAMNVSHETIYKALFVQGRGELRRELTRHLRTQRSKRVPRTRQVTVGRIIDMVNISQRPASVADRAVAGHWEGDLVFGRNGQSCVGTLVERASRFVMLLHLPKGKGAEHVREAMSKKILTLPSSLRRSLTVDQGKEFAQHARFTVDTDVKVYFCDPHSPWQRGSNENTNGLLRQYFPKGMPLDHFGEAELDAIAAQLNGRPRQTLKWRTPSEVLNELMQ